MIFKADSNSSWFGYRIEENNIFFYGDRDGEGIRILLDQDAILYNIGSFYDFKEQGNILIIDKTSDYIL